MIVADSTNFVRFVRSYWKYLVAVVVVLIAVEIANDYVNLDRRTLSPTSIGLVVTALSIFLVFPGSAGCSPHLTYFALSGS